MPTGYAAKIESGITFNEFIMDCARAFGACVTMRDDPGGGEQIPEKFEPTDYHSKAIAKATAELARLRAMDSEQCSAASALAHLEAEASRNERLAEKITLKAKYESMLAEVELWEPPTSEHDELKKFMRPQIKLSLPDCNLDCYNKPTTAMTGEAWLADKMASAERDIRYHTKEHAEEVERAESRTAWVKALRNSLEAPQ